MRLSLEGRIVEEEWLRAADVRPNVALDAFVAMPNHLHGILIIQDTPRGYPRVLIDLYSFAAK